MRRNNLEFDYHRHRTRTARYGNPVTNTSHHYPISTAEDPPSSLSRNTSFYYLLIPIGLLMAFLLSSTIMNTNTLFSSKLKIDQSAKTACPDAIYPLERHNYDFNHGDVCRSRQGKFNCPVGCTATAGGNPPFCYNSKTGKACRVARDPNVPYFRCDQNVCVMATAIEDAVYKDDACGGHCGDATTTTTSFRCRSDWDCSLAGECNVSTGVCACDAWATGADCSYLNFLPVDKEKLGYMDPRISSWGGSVRRGASDGMWHMFMSEIKCDGEDRCGLDKWQSHSQVAHAVAEDVAGPYTRLGVVLPMEHHNPTVVAESDGDGGETWYLYSIRHYSGPTEVVSSTDDGYTWTDPVLVSKVQNPAPMLLADGSMHMFYRGDGAEGTLPSPTCSEEYVARQDCSSPTGGCGSLSEQPVFRHTAEDPMIFKDRRGNYHMLMNVMPYKCAPKYQQGGHAWSEDGVTWSEPRVGAFTTTVRMSDGSEIKCERRERPQMIMDPDLPGVPLALSSALTGCPRRSFNRVNKGGTDCFTLVQLMARA